MDRFAASGRFSREEEADEEQEDASTNSMREISFMPAAGTAAAADDASASTSCASASAASGSSSAPFRSASASASGVDDAAAGASGSGGGGGAADAAVEKEHMFDKVVTPSDVGKLNRLVIPKQYAEKYFPLDAAAAAAAGGNDKGLLLGFEDSAGKHWRFRYSYWNSSQSYVMTKGWSRFVKEKRLVAGDTVSFSRAAADDARHRLFIDWKRRVDAARGGPLMRFSGGLALPMSHYGGPHQYHHYAPWGFGVGGGGGGGGGGSFFMPPSPPATLYEHHRLRQGLDFRTMTAATYPAAPTVGMGRQLLFFGSSARMPPHHAPPPPPPTQQRPLPLPLHHYTVQPSAAAAAGASRPVVLDSVPVIESPTTAAKRVRLFGVNLDNSSKPPLSESDDGGGGEGSSHHHQGNAPLSLQMPGWQQRAPTLRLLELPPGHGGAECSAASSSPSSSSSSKREARSALDLDL